MKELTPGHRYSLQNLKDSDDAQTEFSFYMDPSLHNGQNQRGSGVQEVLRMCIARVKHLDSEKPAEENDAIIQHLREAMMLFELRALRIKLEELPIEMLPTNYAGHTFELVSPGPLRVVDVIAATAERVRERQRSGLPL